MRRRLAPIVILAALLALPAHAGAHGGHLPLQVPAIGPAQQLSNGLYKVVLRTGPPLLTHGVDGPEASKPLPTPGSRAPVCTSSLHQRVLYGRHVLAPDRLEHARPIIETALWQMNAELNRAAVESGHKHADYRVKCDGGGRVQIDTFVNLATSSFADVVDAARLSGALDPNTDYTIFYDDPTPDACGVGSFTPDDRPGADNANNAGGGYAVVYSDCWDAATVMHENGHNQGAVQPDAPNGTGEQGHCRDEADVMCYADGGSRDSGTVLQCEGGERFDCNYDDYFDAAPEPGEYLASHWNIGSPANRFIEFSALDPSVDPASVDANCVHVDPSEVDGARPLAIDTLTCVDDAGADEETDEEPAVRIVRRELRMRAGRVQVTLDCPPARSTDCRGRLSLTHRAGRTVGSRSFRVTAGRSARVRVAIDARARRRWARGRLLRVRVVATDRAQVSTARSLLLRRATRRAR